MNYPLIQQTIQLCLQKYLQISPMGCDINSKVFTEEIKKAVQESSEPLREGDSTW